MRQRSWEPVRIKECEHVDCSDFSFGYDGVLAGWVRAGTKERARANCDGKTLVGLVLG
jgi:hypothetical protein